MAAQVKLLRVIEQGEFTAVGDVRPRKCNVRVVAATNRDLQQSVQEGRFREDLLYRLAAVSIRLPPLRQRIDDIPLLAHKLMEDINRSMRCSYSLAPDAIAHLKQYHYPGNVRELRNVLVIAAARSDRCEIKESLINTVINNLPNNKYATAFLHNPHPVQHRHPHR